MGRSAWGVVAVTAAIALAASAATAGPQRAPRTIDVRPGELHDAIERADGGDTLQIHPGRYRGRFVIDKSLILRAVPGERRPVIDGRCRTRVTLAVSRGRVHLHRLQVVGAGESAGELPSEVEFQGVRRGGATDLLVRDTCDAEYGINVVATGPVTVRSNRATGFSDAGIYVGAITDTGSGVLRVLTNESFRNNRGFIVEDSLARTRIRFAGNVAHHNRAPGEGIPSGYFLHRADGIVLARNVARRNGRIGFHLDPDSDRNRLFENLARRNPRNIVDQGDGNCGRRNRPNTLPAC